MTVITVLAAILAVAATVLAFIFIVPEGKAEKLGKFWKIIHKTITFKYLVLEKVLQALYILSTAFVILMGFFMLFYVQPGYSGLYFHRPSVWYGGYGLLFIILGPIAVRIVYEASMMLLLLVKNVIQINGKVKAPSASTPTKPLEDPNAVKEPTPAPVVAPEPVNKNNAAFCPNCGTKTEGGNFCITCGQKL